MRGSWGRSLALAGVLIAFAPSMTFAEEKDRKIYTIWHVQLPEAFGATSEVENGTVFIKQKLYPTSLVEFTDPFLRAGSSQPFPKGTQLFSLLAPIPVFCALSVKNESGLEVLDNGKGGKHYCFVDADSDSKFERYFEKRVTVPGLPIVDGDMPEKLQEIDPVPYQKIDQSNMSREYWVGIEYKNKAFGVSFGDEKSKSSLSIWKRIPKGEYPITSTLLGAYWALLGIQGEMATIRVDASIPPQPFSPVRTIKYAAH
jgi:hypothetical protein